MREGLYNLTLCATLPPGFVLIVPSNETLTPNLGTLDSVVGLFVCMYVSKRMVIWKTSVTTSSL